MKRIILGLVFVALMAAPAMPKATLDGVSPHLGWWAEDAPTSTHQYWDFSANVQEDGDTFDWIATPPTEIDNTAAAASIGNGDDSTLYDAGEGWFTDPEAIQVVLNMKNYPPNAYKEIYVDIGYTGELVVGNAWGIGNDNYEVTYLDPYACGTDGFGVRIVPNPVEEYVTFTILAPDGAPAILDWVHVDTICIPAPGAVLLGGIGVCVVGWLRRRRTL